MSELTANIILSPRLQAVADLVPQGAVLADIGTDHGYLPAALLQQGRITRAIAGDYNRGPYLSACQLAAEQGLEERMSVRLGNGLSVLQPGEADTVSICGMGGQLMLEILAAAPEVLAQVRRLILQPQRHNDRLRNWLAEHDWRIVEERLVEDNGHIFEIIAAERGEMQLSRAEAEFGPLLLAANPPLLHQRLQEVLAQEERVCAYLAQQGGEEAARRHAELAERCDYLRQLAAQLAMGADICKK